MKSLSLRQPYANWVINGEKLIETRKWRTNYRGDILICSSQKPKIEPYGMALGIVELYHVEPMHKSHEKWGKVEVYPRAQSWFLRNIRKFKKPFPVKGKLSFFEVEVPEGLECEVIDTPDIGHLMREKLIF